MCTLTEVEAYMERSRSEALSRLPSLPNLPQRQAGKVLDDSEIEPAASQRESIADAKQSTSADADPTESNAESASGQEQPAHVPAMTAETQPDAVLPSVEASPAIDAPSEAEAERETEAEPKAEATPETAEYDDIDKDGSGASGQQLEAEKTPETAEYDDIDKDGNGASGQQPADTRADFAEIQKVLGHAASQDTDDVASSESDSAASEDNAIKYVA